MSDVARICYEPKDFRAASLEVIRQAADICRTYQNEGYDLTLRQLYYQFVARGLIANEDSEYKRLGSIINDARMAGLLDWDYIVDRTRNLREQAHWSSPQEIVGAIAHQYREELWEEQPYRVEVWIEKDALVGVIERICNELDVPHFSCRGYTSQSEMHVAAMRLRGYLDAGQEPIILHLGDHDPSGIDMTRDVTDRLSLFMDHDLEVDRLALNMDQVQQYDPPPNPAKITDSRAPGYISIHGRTSWELDALAPPVLTALIRNAIEARLDQAAWDEALSRQEGRKDTLRAIRDRWSEVERLVAS